MSKADMSPEQKEYSKLVNQRARELQRVLEREAIEKALPKVIEAFTNEEDEFSPDFTVEYMQTWTKPGPPSVSLVVRSARSYFTTDDMQMLVTIARALGMRGSVRGSGREWNDDGEHMLEFGLRPSSPKGARYPSEEAVEAAKVELAGEGILAPENVAHPDDA